jgi:hypothetical protein
LWRKWSRRVEELESWRLVVLRSSVEYCCWVVMLSSVE